MNYLPTLETERLIIRPIKVEDTQQFFEMDSQPEVHTYLNQQPILTIEDTSKMIEAIHQQYEKYGIGRVAVIEKETDQFIGWTGFKYIDEPMNGRVNFLDIGYRFRKEAWGKGYATEAAKACMSHYFENLQQFFDLHPITHLDNKSSRHVLEKVGFEVTETFHLDIWNIDCYWYDLK